MLKEGRGFFLPLRGALGGSSLGLGVLEAAWLAFLPWAAAYVSQEELWQEKELWITRVYSGGTFMSLMEPLRASQPRRSLSVPACNYTAIPNYNLLPSQ